MCDARDWATLRRGDQLSREIRRGVVLHGFREGALAFRPTFKLADDESERKGDSKANPEVGGSIPPSIDDDKIRDDQSSLPAPRAFSRKRVPSWCDRVTFGSLPGVNNGRRGVRVKAYGACHGLTTSDHAPVYASLDVAIRGVEEDDDAGDGIEEEAGLGSIDERGGDVSEGDDFDYEQEELEVREGSSSGTHETHAAAGLHPDPDPDLDPNPRPRPPLEP